MKPTGLNNPLTGEPMMQVEESDLDFSLNWDDLSLEKKADFCSFIQAPFLNKQNEDIIKDRWEYYQSKDETIL